VTLKAALRLNASAAVHQFLQRLANPLVLILLFASLISAFSGAIANAALIAGILFFSIALDFYQEHKANKSAERLLQSVALKATLIRDGFSLRVPVSELKAADVVLVKAGDLIPADCLVLEAHDFFVNQASLTGEAFPVEKKKASDIETMTRPAQPDSTGSVFMGSAVISGQARLNIVFTGNSTLLGKISEQIKKPQEISVFERSLHKFGMLISKITVLLVVLVLVINIYGERPLIESLLFSVALAVGLTPELLPMVMTVTLTRGALRVSSVGLIVKRLTALHDLGAMNVLCTDKTGTLTEANISLCSHVDMYGDNSQHVLELAYLNSHFETGIKSSLDQAILEHGAVATSNWKKIDEVPFDFERRRVSVLLEKEGKRWLIVKGAPEDIISLCTRYESLSMADLRLQTETRRTIQATQQKLEQQGFRMLAIAWRAVDIAHDDAVVGDETTLVFAGFLSFFDPPKESARNVLLQLSGLGIATKIITGDAEAPTRAAAKALDFSVTGVLCGQDIAHLDNTALRARIHGVNVFCRMNPAQKERIVRAFQQRGAVVGYLGDGINDAACLHTADIGLSVDSAVDVAKESADIILTSQDLNAITAGVHEGRRSFGNIQKYILMGSSSNFGNMISMACSSFLLPFFAMLPSQILLNNLLYDLSQASIPFDHVDEKVMQKPTRWNVQYIKHFMLGIGTVSSIFDLLMFYILISFFKADEEKWLGKTEQVG